MTAQVNSGSSDVRERKIVLTGGAGLVGQNLVPRLKLRGYRYIVAIDKNAKNIGTLRRLHPDIATIEADLAKPGPWRETFADAGALIINHAQIGALTLDPFIRNNIEATKAVLNAAREFNVPYIIHISSSVLNSFARDFYTETKRAQEQIILDGGIATCVLRPTLMFGWFDRKHLGWLGRFMAKTPIFPIPGDGRYLRQPLYVGDFCNIIASCIETPRPGQVHNISGLQKIDYIDLMREVKVANGARARIVKVPYHLFWLLLWTYALLDRNPPFTTQQLAALVTPDVFEVIDWPAIFGVKATPLRAALTETFRDPVYSQIALEF